MKCEEKAIYEHNNLKLCKTHFLSYFEDKVAKTIKKFNLYEKGDKVCVAASGGKDSLAVLYMTSKYCKKHHIDFFALAIDEGIGGYRDHTLDDLRAFCETHGIQLEVASFHSSFGQTLDMIRDDAIKNHNKKPCTVCGVMRRTLLNRNAKRLGATKLATGHNLDDESQSFCMNLFKGNMRHNASLGPITGINQHANFVTRVKPLYYILEKETRLYTFLKGFKVEFTECPNIDLSFRSVIRDKLNELESQFPGTKNGIVNAFMDALPDLKEKYRGKNDYKVCERCSDPCSGKICNACKLEEQLCRA